jgi:hypothetical protein
MESEADRRDYGMSDKVAEMMLEAQTPATTPLAEGKAVSPLMSSMEFTGMRKSITALIEAVVQTNLRTMQELLRAENPRAMLELQQRFACEYTTVLMQGTLALVDAIESATAG